MLPWLLTDPAVMADPHLDWLINDFIRATPDVGSAMVVSGDGLVLAASTVIDEALGDRLAAITSGLVSLASGAAEMLDADPVRQTIVEMGGGYLFISSISADSALAVFASTCTPIGNPAASRPAGTEMAHAPVRLVGMVHTSDRYMARGSDVFAPSSNAVVGDVGASSTSKRS